MNEQITLKFDGGASPNPGRASCAYRATSGGRELVSRSWIMDGIHSNNEAEWEAAVTGVEEVLIMHPQVARITVMGDSELVVNQANGFYKVTKAHLRVFSKRLDEARRRYPDARIVFKHIRRELNEDMDLACKAVR